MIEVTTSMEVKNILCGFSPGGRRHILRNGNLVISPVTREDAGNYTCEAKNEYGSDRSSGQLIVLRK